MIELRARRVWLRLAEEVVIARARERHAEVIQVELRHGSAVTRRSRIFAIQRRAGWSAAILSRSRR